ncbi:MAG TPA: hypothetical protein PLW14_03125 [Chlorobiota bacterium]|nr:hypothetical protein [Chlorobiota bacterium]
MKTQKSKAIYLSAGLGFIFLVSLILPMTTGSDGSDVVSSWNNVDKIAAAAEITTSIGLMITLYYLYRANNPELKPFINAHVENLTITQPPNAAKQLVERVTGPSKEQVYKVHIECVGQDPLWLQYAIDGVCYVKNVAYTIPLLDVFGDNSIEAENWILMTNKSKCTVGFSSSDIRSRIRTHLEKLSVIEREFSFNHLATIAIVTRMKIGRYKPDSHRDLYSRGSVEESLDTRDCTIVSLYEAGYFVVPYKKIDELRPSIDKAMA